MSTHMTRCGLIQCICSGETGIPENFSTISKSKRSPNVFAIFLPHVQFENDHIHLIS